MEETNMYRDIAIRNNGEVYIGVVGPVRTGKSTFIKKFMDTLVIPNMTDIYQVERTRDEMPQSAGGRTIMTTEPKFIPNEAVDICPGDNAHMKVRMIDCVGYIVDESLGYQEDGQARMVNTPWFTEPIPFNDAAELGTKKVICDHSTIGLVITCDGSFSEIPRENYIDAENRVISELKAINKPFIVLVNSANPDGENAQNIAEEIANAHSVSVMTVNCEELTGEDITEIMNKILMEFPIKEIRISTPAWLKFLDDNHKLREEISSCVKTSVSNANNIRDVNDVVAELNAPEYVSCAKVERTDLGQGTVNISLELCDKVFYDIITECSGTEIKNDEMLLEYLCDIAKMRREYDHIKDALESVRRTGYGVVSPTREEMVLDEPKIVKQGGRYGIKLKANAPSIHMMRADIEAAITPIVGTIKQSEELVEHLLEKYEDDSAKLWETNIFGKTLNELVNDGLKNKLERMPVEAQGKLRETLERIINEGSGGLICLIL